MTEQEVAKNVMRVTRTTQADIAERMGLAGQSTVSMYLRGKSMRVDSLLTMLNACGYELVARDTNGKYPEFVIGDHPVRKQAENDPDGLREMVRSLLAEELRRMVKEGEV